MKRLLHEVVRAGTHGGHGHRHIAMTGDEDDGQLAIVLQHLAQHGQAVAAGQAHIGHDHGGRLRGERSQRAFRVGKRLHRHIRQRERLLAAQAHHVVVFDQEDRCVIDGGRQIRRDVFRHAVLRHVPAR